MFKLPLLALCTALIFSSCASRYATSPPDAAVSPNPDGLLKKMSTRLASAQQYRFTVSNTVPGPVARALHQPTNANIEVVLARPDRLAATITSKGATVREMIFDGRTFTVVDGQNNFYSQASLRGSLDAVASQMEGVYGFRPPLAEFIVTNPYRDIKNRVASVSYAGNGTVREGGRLVPCHRLAMPARLADAELWIGADDSLPRRLKVTKKDSGGRDLLVDVSFLTWDLKPQVSGSTFRHQPSAGAERIPMITVAEANAGR